MTICYDILWNLMRANKMKKGELARAAYISQYMMTKLNNDKSIYRSIMMNIRKVFHCYVGDILEFIEKM